MLMLTVENVVQFIAVAVGSFIILLFSKMLNDNHIHNNYTYSKVAVQQTGTILMWYI